MCQLFLMPFQVFVFYFFSRKQLNWPTGQLLEQFYFWQNNQTYNCNVVQEENNVQILYKFGDCWECAENALKMNNRKHINNGNSTIPLFE